MSSIAGRRAETSPCQITVARFHRIGEVVYRQRRVWIVNITTAWLNWILYTTSVLVLVTPACTSSIMKTTRLIHIVQHSETVHLKKYSSYTFTCPSVYSETTLTPPPLNRVRVVVGVCSDRPMIRLFVQDRNTTQQYNKQKYEKKEKKKL